MRYVIKVLDTWGNWYENAYVENDFDLVQIAKFYRDQLGYEVRLYDKKNDKDITFLMNGKTVRVVRNENN